MSDDINYRFGRLAHIGNGIPMLFNSTEKEMTDPNDLRHSDDRQPATLSDRIARFRELRERATADAWRTDGDKVVGFDSYADVDGSQVAECTNMVSKAYFSRNITRLSSMANAEFIAAAANDAVPLLDECQARIKEERERADRLEAKLLLGLQQLAATFEMYEIASQAKASEEPISTVHLKLPALPYDEEVISHDIEEKELKAKLEVARHQLSLARTGWDDANAALVRAVKLHQQEVAKIATLECENAQLKARA